MKCLMFVLLVFVACTTAEQNEESAIEGLTQLFSISAQEVKKCLDKTGIERARFLEHLVTIEDAFEEGGRVSKEFERTASCFLVCCAQAQGTMVGSELQMGKIVQLLRDAESPRLDQQLKAMFMMFLKHCEQQVKGITDACDVAFAFLKCMHNKFSRPE